MHEMLYQFAQEIAYTMSDWGEDIVRDASQQFYALFQGQLADLQQLHGSSMEVIQPLLQEYVDQLKQEIQHGIHMIIRESPLYFEYSNRIEEALQG